MSMVKGDLPDLSELCTYKIYEIEIQIHMKKKTFTHKHTLTILRKYKFIHIYHLLCRLDSNYRLDNSDLIPIEIQHTAAQLKTRKKNCKKKLPVDIKKTNVRETKVSVAGERLHKPNEQIVYKQQQKTNEE